LEGDRHAYNNRLKGGFLIPRQFLGSCCSKMGSMAFQHMGIYPQHSLYSASNHKTCLVYYVLFVLKLTIDNSQVNIYAKTCMTFCMRVSHEPFHFSTSHSFLFWSSSSSSFLSSLSPFPLSPSFSSSVKSPLTARREMGS